LLLLRRSLLAALLIFKSLLPKLADKLGLSLLAALLIFKSLLSELGAKLGLSLLTTLLVSKTSLRLLHGILVARLSHTRRRPALLLQNVAG
jgi:hypothetical protein